MSRSLTALTAALLLAVLPARADAPFVVADIAPVHSLVARVMEGIGAPDLLIRPGASPHAYNLRPSEARALERADIVFWVGAALTPGMAGTLDTLAGDARRVELLDAAGTVLLPAREDGDFARHEAPESADDHAHDHEDHDHGDLDPHAWLSTENAATWLGVIARELSEADPANAAAYAANADAATAEIAALRSELLDLLGPLQGRPYIVFHDAFQYFEADFGLPSKAALSVSDARDPGPARVEAMRDLIVEEGILCVLTEPQFSPSLVTVITEGTGAGTAALDPLGADLEPGPGLYPELLQGLGDALAGCL